MPRIPFWIFIVLAVLYFSAVRVDIMDIDASQYAEISREMAQTKDYLHIYDRGNNYLDKPPMLFWLSAASIQCFGATNFGYKLPSILLALLALFATYRLAKLLYDEETGRMAALILGCCQGVFLMTNDVRCDLVLMGWTITGVWLLKEWLVNKRIVYLIGASIAIAFGMMTKGPIALLAPAFALGSDFILKRQWRNIFKPAYLLLLIVVALILIPMSIGLYQQYDLHTNKWIDGKTGISGLKFFFWTQSFGRITGENSWNNGADLSFQLVNMLWSFLPWIFLFLPALFINIQSLVRQRFRLSNEQEWLSTGGFLLCYLAVGMSKYQLPHYIFVAFPFAAIMCAQLLRDFYALGKYPKLERVLRITMIVAGNLLFTGVLLILMFVFPANIVWFILWGLSLTIWLLVLRNKQLKAKILWIGAVVIILVNFFLTNHFYFQLMQYQVGTVVGKYIHAQQIPADRIITYRMHDPLNSLHFNAQQVIRIFENGYVPSQKGDYILTQEDGLKDLQSRGFRLSMVLKGDMFKVSELTGDFINIHNRSKATSVYYFLKVE
jgi:4-amino-4-deoxy-L-arabinose transferase-like glycosyltransferase